MIPAKEYMDAVKASEKMKRGESVTPDEQALAEKYAHLINPKPKLCGMKGCTNELGPRADGEHRSIDGIVVCEDCYFGDLGGEAEKFPSAHGVRRRG